MSHPDPYAAIEKRRLAAPDGMKSSAYTVRLADPADASGWREVGVVSESYLLVPNDDVRDLAYEVADRSGLGFEEERTFFDGRRYGLFLTAREHGLVEVAPGDAVGLGMAFQNSYDGSQRLAASLFIHRLACSNGMIVPTLFRRVAFKHDPSGAHWEQEVARALSMLTTAHLGLQRFAEAARALSAMRVTAGRLREVRRDVLAKLPVSTWGRVIDQFLAHEALDGWGLLNAASAVLWHDEKPTVATFRHNEYAATGLVEYALGQSALASASERRN